jgi:hypothetical protein
MDRGDITGRRHQQWRATIGRMRTLATVIALLCTTAHADTESERNAKTASDFGAAEDVLAKVRANPKLMRLALSARVCAYREWREHTVTEIGKQKHYSAIGGVVDLRVMQTLQRRLRALDEFLAADRAGMRRIKVKAATCGGKEMDAVFACVNGATWPECQDPQMLAVIGIINEHDDIPGAELFRENE